MAIDAVIHAVDEDGRDLILELYPRGEGGSRSVTGQNILTVKDFQYKPEVGDEVWGGDTWVHIERKNKRPTLHYKRVGYGELREDHDYGMRDPISPRYA